MCSDDPVQGNVVWWDLLILTGGSQAFGEHVPFDVIPTHMVIFRKSLRTKLNVVSPVVRVNCFQVNPYTPIMPYHVSQPGYAISHLQGKTP